METFLLFGNRKERSSLLAAGVAVRNHSIFLFSFKSESGSCVTRLSLQVGGSLSVYLSSLLS